MVPLPLAPVYDLRDDADSNFMPNDLKIWPLLESTPDPVCLCSNDSSWKDLHGKPSDLNGLVLLKLRTSRYSTFSNRQLIAGGLQEGTVTFVFHETPFTFKKVEGSDAGNAGIFLELKTFSEITGIKDKRSIPYGFSSHRDNGKLQKYIHFYVKVSPESQSLAYGSKSSWRTQSLLYIIEKHTASDFLNYGISVEMLRLMILPMLDAYKISNIHTLEKYIEWIVKR